MEWFRDEPELLNIYDELADRYGDDKGEATHVRLTVEEYDELQRTIASYENGFAKVKQSAVLYKQKVDADAQNAVDRANAATAAAEAEAARQASLNKNLLRIIRERKNAERGIQKKLHGYRYYGKIMQTKSVASYDKKAGAVYADTWSAILESPYDGTLPIEQIQDHILSELTGDNGILKRMDIVWFESGDSGSIRKSSYTEAIEDGKDSNYLFDYKFQVNSVTGLWEIQIMTTKPIPVLPELLGQRAKNNERLSAHNANE